MRFSLFSSQQIVQTQKASLRILGAACYVNLSYQTFTSSPKWVCNFLSIRSLKGEREFSFELLFSALFMHSLHICSFFHMLAVSLFNEACSKVLSEENKNSQPQFKRHLKYTMLAMPVQFLTADVKFNLS